MERTAAGILEVRGMAALMSATDAMLKTTEVVVGGLHGIGSGWLTVIVEGPLAAVERAIVVGEDEARRHGDVIHDAVVPRLEREVFDHMPHAQASASPVMESRALGMLETRGLTPLIVGTDTMLKSAEVELAGWAYIGGALCHAVVRGDVAAVRQAVSEGVDTASEAGEVYAHLVIPRPSSGLSPLMPPVSIATVRDVGALGVLETTGYGSAVAGSDIMVKTGEVELLRFTIGSGGRVVSLVAGKLDHVQAALEAGEAVAVEAGEVNARALISRPEGGLMAGFGGIVIHRTGDVQKRAMGLLETRSTVGLVTAMDAMLKASDVEFEGNFKVGYFLTASVIRGDTGAVKVALDVGAEEAQRHGELVTAHLIPQLFPNLEARLVHE